MNHRSTAFYESGKGGDSTVRYTPNSCEQAVLVPVDLKDQLQPGTFEYALNQILEEMDLSLLAERF